MNIDHCLNYLKSIGADKEEHTHCNLYDHLHETYNLLVAEGAEDHVCLAGLFHSVYGNDIWEVTMVTLEERNKVKQLIGDRAERLVWLFNGIGNRFKFYDQYGSEYKKVWGEDVYVSPEEELELLTIFEVNATEQGDRK